MTSANKIHAAFFDMSSPSYEFPPGGGCRKPWEATGITLTALMPN
jgi:hypothetical protein